MTVLFKAPKRRISPSATNAWLFTDSTERPSGLIAASHSTLAALAKGEGSICWLVRGHGTIHDSRYYVPELDLFEEYQPLACVDARKLLYRFAATLARGASSMTKTEPLAAMERWVDGLLSDEKMEEARKEATDEAWLACDPDPIKAVLSTLQSVLERPPYEATEAMSALGARTVARVALGKPLPITRFLLDAAVKGITYPTGQYYTAENGAADDKEVEGILEKAYEHLKEKAIEKKKMEFSFMLANSLLEEIKKA